jgi:peptidoglycan/xylan/chitin deacetylase (PgdA/CDA1 family)
MHLLYFLFLIASSNAKLFLSLTFDDGLPEHYQVSTILQSYGMLGTFYINSGRLNVNGRISINQMLDMQTNNHEIAGHTVNHLNLTR